VVGAKPELRRAVVAQLAPRVWPRGLHRPVFGVGRMTQIATNGFQMYGGGACWGVGGIGGGTGILAGRGALVVQMRTLGGSR